MSPIARGLCALAVLLPIGLAVVALTSPAPQPLQKPPASDTEAWNAYARQVGEEREREEAKKHEEHNRAVAREQLRIYDNCMKTDKTIFVCAKLAGLI